MTLHYKVHDDITHIFDDWKMHETHNHRHYYIYIYIPYKKFQYEKILLKKLQDAIKAKTLLNSWIL